MATGLFSQVVFMAGYNFSVLKFEPRGYSASTIYALFYTLYIPFGHLLQCLFVFGWPHDYLPSLASNAPIGISGMALGTALTGLLSNIKFDSLVEDLTSSMFATSPPDHSGNEGEFYASLVVMVATGVWGYLYSSYVNASPPEIGKSEKDPAKEL